MKIGIVTFWESKDNFGQILQCYALQTILKKMGHTPVLIRTSRICSKNNPSLKLKLKNCLRKVLHLNYLRYGGKDFDKFIETHISCTDKIYHSKTDFISSELDYDAIICGSDVVWSEGVGTGAWGELCFLDFFTHPIKKISYAASFGASSLSKEFSDFAKEKIVSFDAISVREKSGVDVCAQLGRDDAIAVCDPTLLLLADDYKKIMPDKAKKVCFGYFIGWPTDVPTAKIKKYVAKKRLKFSRLDSQNSKRSIKNLLTKPKTIPEWLVTYANANCIFTNSFHGTIFAILFNKPFLFLPIKGSAAKLNNRVENLLQKLNLMERIWNPNFSIEEQMNRKIDWGQVNVIVEQWRNDSTEWMTRVLER
jgi:hypothetical protein